jgi:hypothetical protein
MEQVESFDVNRYCYSTLENAKRTNNQEIPITFCTDKKTKKIIYLALASLDLGIKCPANITRLKISTQDLKINFKRIKYMCTSKGFYLYEVKNCYLLASPYKTSLKVSCKGKEVA